MNNVQAEELVEFVEHKPKFASEYTNEFTDLHLV